MTDNPDAKYQSCVRKAWMIYALLTVAIVAVLFFFVATDNEERFFYTIMPAATAYVLRPTDEQIGRLVKKFWGVSKPSGD